jgi:4-hydroxybenzoate polyprenyltransferase
MSLFKRLWQYQKERFPLFGHGPLIAIFSFSAVSYARICRGESGFIAWPIYWAGVFVTLTLFLLVRIFDEHKDAEEDAAHRSHLPVPRGLVTLGELRWVAYVVVALQLAVHAWFFPKMLPFYLLVVGYLSLMGKEFFVADWLKARPFWYVTSHMFIIPLVDVYASGLDWHLAGVAAPVGLLWFFAVSYMNGIVLEVGRKIKTPEKEEINTYSTMLGMDRATRLWLIVLAATLLCSYAAAWYAGYGWLGIAILTVCFTGCAIPGILMLQRATAGRAKGIEIASAVWTAAMYLTLGGVPMLMKLLG